MSGSRIRGPKQFHSQVVFGRTKSGTGEGHPITFDALATFLKPRLGLVGGKSSTVAAGSTSPVTHGFGFFIGGLMLSGELIGGVLWNRNITFSADGPYNIVSQVQAAASATFHLVTGTPDTTVGTIVFAAGSKTGVLAWTAPPLSLPAGTQLRLRSPSPADASLYSVSGTVDGVLA